MSIKPPSIVDSAIVAEHDEDQSMILTLSTKTGEFEFLFTLELWQKLGETAKWFAKSQEITKP